MRSEYIPFINGANDCTVARSLYSDAATIRISLESIEKVSSSLPSEPKRWVDAGIDGLHSPDLSKLSDSYLQHLRKFEEYQRIADAHFRLRPDKEVAKRFVCSVLDRCSALKPDWISIPQLPLVSDSSRNKINKLLSELAQQWRANTKYAGKFILPAIFTNQNQLNGKTERNKKIASIMACFEAAGADGVWSVDSSLNDQEGSGRFDERFAGLRRFHEELNEKLPEEAVTVCGPYWGMNLVLWARGAVRFPAIALGSSYKYNIPGPKLRKANVHVALPPLRRWAIASPQLKVWLTQTVAALAPGDPARTEFVALEREFSRLQSDGRMQTAIFYKAWVGKFLSLPQPGRGLALYQDLSAAYVLGKSLHPLPKDEGTARRPERVAQQLMLKCL